MYPCYRLFQSSAHASLSASGVHGITSSVSRVEGALKRVDVSAEHKGAEPIEGHLNAVSPAAEGRQIRTAPKHP